MHAKWFGQQDVFDKGPMMMDVIGFFDRVIFLYENRSVSR